MKHARAELVRAHGPAIFEVGAGDPFLAEVQSIHSSVARRAYHLFTGDGYAHGHDLDHWLRAESQLLNSVAVELKETERELIVHADVPGLQERDLTLKVEPRRLYITGKRQSCGQHAHDKTIYSEFHSDEIFRALDFPVEIDPDSVHAHLNQGVLEVTMAKRTEAGRAPKAA
ncbi:MAG TPA: Hsp20 family protein [Candidatus Sulfotelmatobacter sp.]|nr:Hsp20 family protein [Candidatus Sulfotelmatobacter sp.]